MLRWTFDTADVSANAVADDSDNSGTGQIQGSYTLVPGKLNQALELNGNAYVTMSASSDSAVGLNNSTTLALWINTESKGTVALLSKYNAAGTGAGHIFRLSGGRPQLVLGGMDSQTYPPMATGTVKVNDGNWHHVTVVITVGEGIQF